MVGSGGSAYGGESWDIDIGNDVGGVDGVGVNIDSDGACVGSDYGSGIGVGVDAVVDDSYVAEGGAAS